MNTEKLDSEFPLKEVIFRGSIFALISHAIFVAVAPFLAHEQSWEGPNYSVQDSEGSRGTIAFCEDTTRFVAVFFLEGSERNPLKSGKFEATGATDLFQTMPDELRPVSERALQYVLQDVDGHPIPICTAAFWSDLSGSRVTACEPWSDVLKHGAKLVKNQILPTENGKKNWINDFEFSPAQASLATTIFDRRIRTPGQPVQLLRSEVELLKTIANGDAGLQACRESFNEIGVEWPGSM